MQIQEHVPLRDLTTLKVGGTARFFCSVSTEHNLKTAFQFAKEKHLPVVILGGGSNVLLSDKEIDAVVVKNEIRGVEWMSYSPFVKGSTAEGGEGFKSSASEDLGTSFYKGGTRENDAVVVIAGAGESWDILVAEAVKRRLWGIENLSGIPGTVGAAPIQNIGAYGAEIKDVLEWVEVYDTTPPSIPPLKRGEGKGGGGFIRRLSRFDCRFGYRDSIFKHTEGKSLIVTRVALRLSKNGKPNLEYKDLQNYFAPSHSPFPKGSIRRGGEGFTPSVPHFPEKVGGTSLIREDTIPALSDIRRAVLEIRSKKFPNLQECGTAGSFFKNPIIPKAQFDALKKQFPDLPGFELRIKDKGLRIKMSLAWILDNICGLKGYAKGNVRLFERQPIVLVNTGEASAEEVYAFAKEVVARVKEKTGIQIEWEVQYLW